MRIWRAVTVREGVKIKVKVAGFLGADLEREVIIGFLIRYIMKVLRTEMGTNRSFQGTVV